MTDRPSEPRTGAQSVERALGVLRTFETVEDGLGVSEIAQRTGLTVSTAHRLTRALCAAGLLTQDPRTERYDLGPVLVVLGRRAEERLGYASVLPVLQDLAAVTGESVNLGIGLGSEVLVVLDAASDQPLRFSQAAGSRVPVHTSAMGKCLLAFAPSIEAAVRVLPELREVTARTITDRDRLRRELEAVRARGWALNDEERNAGVRAVAAPVLDDATGTAVAAIAVQGPTVRLPDDRLEAVGAQITAAAATVAPLLAAAMP